jgi:hypothetical protein
MINAPEPGQIYEDANGDRWLVKHCCMEPSVTMQRIEPQWGEGHPPPFEQGGGVTGLMWQGFKKVLEAPVGK